MSVLVFDRVSKRYRIHRGSRSVTGWVASHFDRLRKRHHRLPLTEDFWALRDVSFEVKPGQTLGVIGPNGSGKSTILKLLSRITHPTAGRIHVAGRIGALLEVSAGFHPELSGRENIYLKAAILGMRKAEVDRKLDAIVSFAELERFLDMPIKRYSSGMALRLGFSVAAHLEPDVLLLDEVLAVGDASFSDKCLRRIAHLREIGTTILFVSHNMAAVRTLCDEALFLYRGEVKALGATESVIRDYYQAVLYAKLEEGHGENAGAGAASASATPGPAITDVRLTGADGAERREFRTGDDVSLELRLSSPAPIDDPSISIAFYEMGGSLVCRFVSSLDGVRLPAIHGDDLVTVDFSAIGLMPGVYEIEIELMDRSGLVRYDRQERQHRLLVLEGKPAQGFMYLPHRWRLGRTNGLGAVPLSGNHDVRDPRVL